MSWILAKRGKREKRNVIAVLGQQAVERMIGVVNASILEENKKMSALVGQDLLGRSGQFMIYRWDSPAD